MGCLPNCSGVRKVETKQKSLVMVKQKIKYPSSKETSNERARKRRCFKIENSKSTGRVYNGRRVKGRERGEEKEGWAVRDDKRNDVTAGYEIERQKGKTN